MKILNQMFRIKRKPMKIMGEYACLHGLVPNNELPMKLRNKIPKHEIWIREDVYLDKKRRNAILRHEKIELTEMLSKDKTYKQAHRKAQREQNKRHWLGY